MWDVMIGTEKYLIEHDRSNKCDIRGILEAL